jgi:hypothetical protein
VKGERKMTTALHTSLENKIKELNSKKELLLINRSKVFNYFLSGRLGGIPNISLSIPNHAEEE